MPYTLAQKNAAAKALCRALPGLNFHAAVCWVTAEQGDNHNILGVTYYLNGRQTLRTFPTWKAGADAAAAIILHDRAYRGIREALKRDDIKDQLHAIATSPWHLGAGGLAKNGGIDPYYARVFKNMGYDVGGK